jgi:hypothetical protein
MRPTHTPTEGRAPECGSDFTTKAASLQGGFGKSLLGYKEKSCFWRVPVCLQVLPRSTFRISVENTKVLKSEKGVARFCACNN